MKKKIIYLMIGWAVWGSLSSVGYCKSMPKIEKFTSESIEYNQYVQQILSEPTISDIINKIGLELSENEINLGDVSGRVERYALVATENSLMKIKDSSTEILAVTSYFDITIQTDSAQKLLKGSFSIERKATSPEFSVRSLFLTDGSPISTQLFYDIMGAITISPRAKEIDLKSCKIYIKCVEDRENVRTQKWFLTSKNKSESFDVTLITDSKGETDYSVGL